MPPRLTVTPERQSRRTLGTNYTLTCNASGDPTPNITWTKEGLTAEQFNVSGHKLDLVDIKVENVGSYKCTADNGYGNPATSLAVVDVKCMYMKLIQLKSVLFDFLVDVVPGFYWSYIFDS